MDSASRGDGDRVDDRFNAISPSLTIEIPSSRGDYFARIEDFAGAPFPPSRIRTRSHLESVVSFTARAILFLTVFSVVQLGWQGLRGSSVETLVVHDATVRPAAYLINLLTPATQVRAEGFSLHAPGGGLNILNGCEGTEALFLLFAGFVVAPLTWRSRMKGFLIGTGVVFVVNQLRIIALFYAYRADHSLFDPLHGTVAPLVVILVVCVYFYAWLSHAAPRATTAA